MYERLTDRARKVMQLANQEAQRMNHEYIGTEHLLCGLMLEGSGVGATILKGRGVTLEKVREEIGKIVQAGPDWVTIGKLPQTPRSKKVLEFAIEEAKGLKQNYLGTEHILLGLLRDQPGDDSVARQVLMSLGLLLEDIRQAVMDQLIRHEEPECHTSTYIVQKSVVEFTPVRVTNALDDSLANLLAEVLADAKQKGYAVKSIQLRIVEPITWKATVEVPAKESE